METAARVASPRSSTAGAMRPGNAVTRATCPKPVRISNQTVQRRLIQPKPAVNQPGDRFEQEADRVAGEVMRMPDAQVTGTPPPIQRRCAECEKHRHGVAQQPCALCEAGPHQGRLEADGGGQALQAKAVTGLSPLSLSDGEAPLEGLHGGGQPLPDSMRQFFEPRFHRDFGAVRLHTGARAAQSARAVHARAYTVGEHIVFGAGEFAPGTSAGRSLLAHELVHTVQQAGSDGAPSLRRKPDPAPQRSVPEAEVLESRKTPGGYRVSTAPLRVVIDNFAIGSPDLKPEHEAVLAELIRILDRAPAGSSIQLVVIGHTDDIGPASINPGLSTERAQAVGRQLRRIRGSDIRLLGEGEDLPAESNETREGRSRNRRVEIFFSVPVPPIPKKPEPVPKKPEPVPKKPEPVPKKPETKPKIPDVPECSLLCSLLPFLGPLFACLSDPLVCVCAAQPEICGLIPRLRDNPPKEKEPPPRPRACVDWSLLPSGKLEAKGTFTGPAGTDFELRRSFSMKVKFLEEPRIGCLCSCGEYRQEVRGWLEENDGSGWKKLSGPYPLMANGKELQRDDFNEDASISGIGLVPYGHRDRRPRGSNPFKNDEYLPRRFDGCLYEGWDNPGLAVRNPPGNMQYRFHLWFKAGPVDVCNGGKEEGSWLRLPGEWKEWECHGQETIPFSA